MTPQPVAWDDADVSVAPLVRDDDGTAAAGSLFFERVLRTP